MPAYNMGRALHRLGSGRLMDFNDFVNSGNLQSSNSFVGTLAMAQAVADT